jgi:lysozyme
MNDDLKLNSAGLELIKKFEGFRNNAYLDTGGVATIGYGTTRYSPNQPVKLGETITEERAEECLRNDVQDAELSIKKLVKVPLTSNQFSALVSFTYNLGATNLRASTLLKLLNKKEYDLAALQFARWVYDNGKRLEGLAKRREAERVLFLTKE